MNRKNKSSKYKSRYSYSSSSDEEECSCRKSQYHTKKHHDNNRKTS